MRLLVSVLCALTTAITLLQAEQRPTHGMLFPPEDLGILESPDRDEWQQADRIMDVLLIGEASRVADLGAGGGWFTIRLADRVGPNGLIYAEDVQSAMIESTRRRVTSRGFKNVEFILGTKDNPKLPTNLDAVLVVDTYPVFEKPVEILKHVAHALAPKGRLGIVDFKRDGVGGPGPPLEERLDQSVIRGQAEQAGLRLLSEETFLRYQYLLVFGKR